MKKNVCILLSLFLVFFLASCEVSPEEVGEIIKEVLPQDEIQKDEEIPKENPPETFVGFGGSLKQGGEPLLQARFTVSEDESGVSKDEKFGAALLNMGQEDFEAIGFCLGDSLDILFDNGHEYLDVPYYNGYYVRNGAPVVVAYPGDPYIRITLNNVGIWDEAELSDGATVLITLNEHGKYSDVQEALGQQYSFDIDDYADEIAFCNFRALKGGKLKDNFLFRGASPVDNSRNRASHTDGLLKENNISYIMDLADSPEDICGYMEKSDFASPYAALLLSNRRMVTLDMGSGYTGNDYKAKVAKGLQSYLACLDASTLYIHCMEGKDRTGFVCLLLEALAGASYDEMLSDYMKTYDNYFGVKPQSTKFKAIEDLYFVPFLEFLHGESDLSILKSCDYTGDARAYLLEGGMKDADIDALLEKICG